MSTQLRTRPSAPACATAWAGAGDDRPLPPGPKKGHGEGDTGRLALTPFVLLAQPSQPALTDSGDGTGWLLRWSWTERWMTGGDCRKTELRRSPFKASVHLAQSQPVQLAACDGRRGPRQQSSSALSFDALMANGAASEPTTGASGCP
eukprot:1099042-Prymnesium_polylepis.1